MPGDGQVPQILVGNALINDLVPGGDALKVNDADGTNTVDVGANGDTRLRSVVGLGAAESATIASGVLTVTKSYVDALPESSTTDQVDSIVMAGVEDGDLLLLVSKATNTITVDDANINLGAATRAIAPGGSLLLYFDGTQWTEHSFLAASDNS